MKFRILEQGVGVTDTPLPKEINLALRIHIEGADGDVVKLVGDNNVSYGKIENGVATFARAELVGRISLSLVRPGGVVPLGAFICVPTENGVMLYQDAETLLSRLAKVERDISDVLERQRDLEAKYEDIIKRLESLFEGYNI